MVAIGFQKILHRKIGMQKNKSVIFTTKIMIHTKSDIHTKDYVLLPFWEEVLKTVVGGESKNFTVYLLVDV